MGFDEPVDEERDPDDGEHGGDAVVVVEEDRSDFEGAFGFSVADLDEGLVFVDFEDPGGGDVAGQVRGERVDAVGACDVCDGLGVACPFDGGFVGVGIGAGGDGEERPDFVADDDGDAVVDVFLVL
ncbi:MAG: hypothetical protein R2754_13915 [Microthrixaceae bacterium]